MSKITKQELVTECATKALTSIVNGNLKVAIEQIVEDVIQWAQDGSQPSGQVLLNETKTPENIPAAVSTPTGPQPAPIGNVVVSNTRSETEGARVGPAPKSPGWSDPFAGTSWGAK